MSRHPGGRTCNGIFAWMIYAAAFVANFGRKR